MKAGDKVTYTCFHTEKGIVKKVVDDDYAFVVYNCAGDWDNYKEYTAAKTLRKMLIPGWEEGENNGI